MNSRIVVEMQNAFGRFIQLYNLNRVDEAVDLFAKEGQLWLPDRGISAVGADAVREALVKMRRNRAEKGYRRDVHIPHTPAFDVVENDTVGLATWDVHSFDFAQGGGDKLEYIYSRVDAKYIEEDARWRFLELDWWEVDSFLPWDYEVEKDDGANADLAALPSPPAFCGGTSGRDFYAIQNVITRFAANNRKHAMEDTFASSDDITFRIEPLWPETACGRDGVGAALAALDGMERENLGKYIFVPATGAPVIEVARDGMHAVGQWMVSAQSFEGEAFGYGRQDGDKLPYRFVRRVSLLSAAFVKEAKGWKVTDYEIRTLFRVPETGFNSDCQTENTGDGRWYQRIGLPDNNWKMAMPKMGGDYPDDLPVLESFHAKWINAYRRGQMDDFLWENSFNEEYESCFHSRGRGLCAPPVVGRDAMLAFFTLGAFRYHHQLINNNSSMAPDIEISVDGRFATVSVFDVNTVAFNPNVANDRTINIPADWNRDNNGFEHTPHRYQLSTYHLSFVKVGGVWKLICVNWESLASLPDILHAGKEARGWAGSKDAVKYPALFEKYRYSPVRMAVRENK